MKIDDYSGQGDYLFANNLTGIEFRLKEDRVYDADDDDEPSPTIEAEVHGKWIRVETGEFEDGYISAVGGLLSELKRLEYDVGDYYAVETCQKEGRKQTDPYDVELVEVEPDQSRL